MMTATQGIIDPWVRCLLPGTRLYRFGDDESKARSGGWWLEEDELLRVRYWAKATSLSFAHGVRVLCAVAHEYGAMRVGVLARVMSPLQAYEGRSRTQTPGRNEYLNPGALGSAPPINQIFVPGLWNRTIGETALRVVKVDHFGAGDSHIGGVPMFPEGAIVQ